MWPRLSEQARRLGEFRQHRAIWRAARRLSTRALQREEPDFDACLDDLLSKDPVTPRFLGFYTRQGLETAFETYGFRRALRKRGFASLRVELSNQDRFTSTLRCYGARRGRDYLLCEMRCRFQALQRPQWVADDDAERCCEGCWKTVRIEWMLLQNPCREFSADRPRLPGQDYPGLGLGREIMEVLRVLGWRLRVAAFDVNPHFVHNAVLYSRQFSFVEPEDQAFFLAVQRLARGRTLQDLGLAVHNGFLRDEENAPVDWPARTQISPLHRPLVRLYQGERYAAAVRLALPRFDGLRFDWPAFTTTRPALVDALESASR